MLIKVCSCCSILHKYFNNRKFLNMLANVIDLFKYTYKCRSYTFSPHKFALKLSSPKILNYNLI